MDKVIKHVDIELASCLVLFVPLVAPNYMYIYIKSFHTRGTCAPSRQFVHICEIADVLSVSVAINTTHLLVLAVQQSIYTAT